MTAQIDNLIFNTLADGHDLYLPDVGSLIVRRNGAVRISSGRLVPPFTDIVFSRELRGEVLTDIIAAKANVSQERATEIYRQWLQHASVNGSILIGGVGEILNEKFITDQNFENMANPEGRNEVRINPVTNYVLLSFAVLCIVFAVGVAGYILYSEQVFSSQMGKGDLPQKVAVESVAAVPVETVAVVGEESVAAAGTEQPLQISETEPVAAPEKTVASEPSADGLNGVLPMTAGYSYAVWGVYAEFANAEAGMNAVNRRFEDIHSRIYRYGDRYMVALYERPTRNECVRIVENLKERSRSFGEVWVYTDRR